MLRFLRLFINFFRGEIMKKFITLFAVFALFFVVSCGGDSKNSDKTDTGDTVSDEDGDTADTEPAGDTGPSGDTGTDTTPDSGDSTPDDADTSNSGDDSDSTDSGDDADSSDSGDDTDTVIEQMNEEKCIAESGTWDAANNKCRKTVNCDSKPEDLTEWNGATTYISEYVNGAWTKVETEHNEEEGPCHFVCEEYVDDERFEYYEPLNKCLDPFEAECVHKGYEGAFMDYDYDPPACVCPSGYHFGEGADSKKCIVMDMNECSALSTVFPCTDSDTGYIWSEETTETMTWEAAKQHCDALGGDWHLPTISELRTLILKCDNLTEMGGMCDVSDNCLSEALCSHTGSNRKGCNVGCGTCVNKFSEKSFVWSQSTLEDDPNAAYIVYFDHGQIISQPKTTSNLMNVRCVRNTTTNPVTDLEKCIRIGGKMNDEGKCLKSIKCDMRPDYSSWNGEYSYIREYSDGTWLGEKIETIYSTEAGVCHFVCMDGYTWDDNDCVEAATDPCASNPCADIANSSCTALGETFECICNEGFGKVDGECKPYCAAVFDGTSSYLKLNKTQSAGLYFNAWTIEAWINQTEINNIHPLVTMQYRENMAYMLTAFSKKNSTSVLVGGGLLTSDGKPSVSVTMGTPTAEWHHIALVNTGSKLQLFIDGNLKESTNYTGNYQAVTNALLFVGKATNYTGSGSIGTDTYFKGAIDQIRFSNIARYAANFTPAPLTSDINTVALWDFNGNANNSKSDTLHLTPTNIEYTTDCR